ncbi:1-acyl-sn-glycerol-3-phosphate acyltransferase, partial [Pseudomonas syringae pv. pisi]
LNDRVQTWNEDTQRAMGSPVEPAATPEKVPA